MPWLPSPLALLSAAAVAALILLICLLGARQARDKITIVKPIQFIGHADEASYALQGRSIAAGHGINVNYVSTFFIPYPPNITHREDHWPPFMGYSIAPFFYFMGEATWIARLPGIFYGSLGLPLATALLAYALSRRGYVALIAGLLIMANPDLYLHSMRTLSDVANAMLLAGFCAGVLLSRRQPWFHVAAGFFLACAYFAKGSEIILLGFYPLLVILCGGFQPFLRRHFYYGLTTALVLMAPYWIANWRDYGNPFHSTQNYVAAFYGFEDWDSNFYKPYWGHDLPKLSDRWEQHPNYWKFTRSQIPLVARAALDGGVDRRGGEFNSREIWSDFGDAGLKVRAWLMGETAGRAEMQWNRSKNPPPLPVKPLAKWEAPVPEVTTLAALALLGLALLAAPAWLAVRCVRWVKRIRGKQTPTALPAARSPFGMIGPVIGIWLIVLAHLAFIVFFWSFDARLCFPVVPLLLALGCTAIACFIEWPLAILLKTATFLLCRLRASRSLPRWIAALFSCRRYARPSFTLALCIAGFFALDTLHATQQRVLAWGGVRHDFPFYGGHSPSVEMGRWLKKNLPHAIIMCRDPWELLFSAGPDDKGIGLPDPVDKHTQGAEQIFAIARYYHVQYFYEDDFRPSLLPYLYHHPRTPGLTRVPGAPRGLYKLDWKTLPPQTVQDFWPK